MRIRQLQYVTEIEKQGFNVSAAALALSTSQPGISKQVRLLEKELGTPLFVREAGRLVDLTPTGKEIIERMRRVVSDVSYVYATCRQLSMAKEGTLTIATTHVQAYYLLPDVIKRFRNYYPNVRITLRQTTPLEILELIYRGEADIGITSDAPKHKDLVVLQCRDIERVVVVPARHPLLDERSVTLRSLAAYPLIGYEAAFRTREKILGAFKRAGLKPSVVLSVSDADVMKTCVERGMGIGVLLAAAYDADRDKGLRTLSAAHLFPPAKIAVLLHRSHHLNLYAFDFIEEFSGKWNRNRVQRRIEGKIESRAA